MDDPSRITRRRFLQTTFAFSAAASLTGCGSGFHPVDSADPVIGGNVHFLMLGDWGVSSGSTEGNPANLSFVANAMAAYVKKYSIALDGLLMLGDNFYDQMPGGVNSPRWQSQFEQVFPSSVFPCPVMAVPGNHDYQFAPDSKYDAQLAYAAEGISRWQMPQEGHSIFVYPPVNPLITFVVLDSNMPNEPAQPSSPLPNSSYYTLTDAQRQAQLTWFQNTLAQPLLTPYLVVMAHHPLYSNGPHGDNQTLIRDWDPVLRAAKAHLYIGGHDHDLQHLELADHPTSFFLSGAGGATLNGQRPSTTGRGPFFSEVHGFSHMQVRHDTMILRHLDTKGNLLHKFTKTPEGVVALLR